MGPGERRFLPNSVRGTAEHATHGAGATREVARWGPVETKTYNHNLGVLSRGPPSNRAQPRESNPPEPSPLLPQSQRWLKTSYRNLLHAAPPMGARSVRASEAGIALDERRFLPNGVRGTAETHGAGATLEVASWGPVETETYNHNHNHSSIWLECNSVRVFFSVKNTPPEKNVEEWRRRDLRRGRKGHCDGGLRTLW